MEERRDMERNYFAKSCLKPSWNSGILHFILFHNGHRKKLRPESGKYTVRKKSKIDDEELIQKFRYFEIFLRVVHKLRKQYCE